METVELEFPLTIYHPSSADLAFIVLLVSEKVLLLVGLNAKITYVVSIILAAMSYLFFVLKFRILSENEIKQLPLGDKIAKIACKPKKSKKNGEKC